MNLDNINGMGAVKFPTDTSFGSGDIPLPANKVYTYSEYINSLKFDKKDDEDEEITEKSVLDQISSNNVQRSPHQQYIDFRKLHKQKLKVWYEQRKTYYSEKIKKAKHAKERKLLNNNFLIEVENKKKEYLEKLRKFRESQRKKRVKS